MRLNLLFLLCSELQQRFDPISLDWFIYPPLSLLPPVFNRLDSFSRCSLRLDPYVSPLEDLSLLALLDQLLHHTFACKST
jgi:hypothetical protein